MKGAWKFLEDPRWSKTNWLSNLSIVQPSITVKPSNDIPTGKEKRKLIREFKWKVKWLDNWNWTRNEKYELIKHLNYVAKRIRKTWIDVFKQQINLYKNQFAMEEINLKWPQVIKRDPKTVDNEWNSRNPWYYLEYNWKKWFHVDYKVWNYARKLKKKLWIK